MKKRSCWNSRLSNLVFLFFVLSLECAAQFGPAPRKGFNTTQDKYTFPVNPGTTGYLSGTMGELRSTHFHAGLDIRTNNMEGIPIRAAMDGYVSRIIIGTGGYGKALLVTHPNGQTTLYGHLSVIKGMYGNYARNMQYLRNSFEVDLFLQPDQLPVKAGDTIAFSGNTGGSNGAHLHFEIRDENNEALNPMQFEFAELLDTYAPIAQKIALKTMDADARINDRFGRFEFYVYRIGNRYVFNKPIMAHGRIGVELLAHDIVDQYKYICGINYIEMKADSQRVFTQTIDKINFLTTRGILTVMDFKTLKNQGTMWNKLYIDDGNPFNYSQGSTRRGIINVSEKDVPVSIYLKDTYGNKSDVAFTLKAMPVTAEARFLDPAKKPLDYDIQENTLAISVRSCAGKSAVLYGGRDQTEITASYGNALQQVYLINLQKALPDSVVTCNGTLRFNFKDAIPSGTDYKFYGDFADVRFQRDALYDTLFLNASEQLKGGIPVFTLGNPLVPLHQAVMVTLKPSVPVPAKSTLGVYRVNNNRIIYLGGKNENGRVSFMTTELGDFTLLEDTIPPLITRLALTHGTARFRIHDRLSGIRSYTATIDGQWLLMNYDYKTGALQSERLDPMVPMKGEFMLRVVDNAGNEKVYTQKIL